MGLLSRLAIIITLILLSLTPAFSLNDSCGNSINITIDETATPVSKTIHYTTAIPIQYTTTLPNTSFTVAYNDTYYNIIDSYSNQSNLFDVPYPNTLYNVTLWANDSINCNLSYTFYINQPQNETVTWTSMFFILLFLLLAILTYRFANKGSVSYAT